VDIPYVVIHASIVDRTFVGEKGDLLYSAPQAPQNPKAQYEYNMTYFQKPHPNDQVPQRAKSSGIARHSFL
jgi:hypothetical protein